MLEYLFPERCHLCDSPLGEGEHFVCPECLDMLAPTNYHLMHSINPMEEKLVGGPRFNRATGCFFYVADNSVARLIQDFKYREFPELAVHMGRLAANHLRDSGFFEGVDVLLPIPLHFLKRMRRGYNQAEQLALGVASVTGLPVGDNLKARTYHRTQTRLDREARERNMSRYFKLAHGQELEGLHVMIVDDVCTTGATLRNAARALQEVPGLEISYFTLATT